MFCLDTNIVIFALNKRRPWIATRLENELRAGTALIVPAILLFELDCGFAKSDRAEHARVLLEGFLSAGIGQPAFDAEDAREAADIRAFLERQGTPISPFNYLVAAAARRGVGDAQPP